MMPSVNMSVLLIGVSLCLMTHPIHSARITDIGRESQMVGDSETAEDFYPPQLHPWFGKRIIDSAEKYFDWAGKTNRPMEYLRGKRFWLFTKKDEHGASQETTHDSNTPSNSVKQGIWRSGIVGRR
ncbi:unnamed protein product [Adineta ricciae]|uniref:Uncharacterized protein n=1 Tax=Adineta ricciae TaxID=249248 RepID=A0A813YWY4_ADIRI|nr:unnamed protein product [Adineta ricciae]CAF0901096.1 unnamed protein product [Adineta ricciae]